ncbi:MAG: hypothetical protein IPJ94_16370 [Chloroflexi bacterium]|nr:hypothetical protein [Chloroflexota bacterium]
MDNKSYTQIQERLNLNKDKIAQLPILKIAVLRNIMVEPIEPYLQFLGFQLSLNTTIHFGEYDNVYQEAVGGQGGLLDGETDVILLFTRLETLSWALTRNYVSLNQPAIEQEVERIQTFIDDVLSGIRRQTKGMILWHSFELPVYPALGIFDYQSAAGQQAAIKSLNDYLRYRLKKTPMPI